MEKKEKMKKYPSSTEYYTLYEEIGHGATSVVHRALCIPLNEIVAVKIIDLEREQRDLDNIMLESRTMVMIDHPNLLKSHCSFAVNQDLWVVTPYMSGGSCQHIIKSAFPDGFSDEALLATLLFHVLKALDHLHDHLGHIHRDVKGGNILVDSKGGIKLGDFGVSVCMFDSGERRGQRCTFTGTPCWMAPEVISGSGYNYKADIWSFGITAMELAQGHTPHSKFPPMKVLIMTLNNPPPTLDLERESRFSKCFKQMIASCLVKDPTKRPSAKDLLKHPFFRHAKSDEYVARKLGLLKRNEEGGHVRSLQKEKIHTLRCLFKKHKKVEPLIASTSMLKV